MKVCDVVCNSIWYDPRVRKQIKEYIHRGVEVCAVGMKCDRYDAEKVDQIPCKTIITKIDERYEGKLKSVFKKVYREHLRNKAICDAVIEEKPDIIHANDLDALIAVYPAYKKLKCKLIYDSHEICVENLGIKRRYSVLLPLMKMYEKYMIRRLDQMVCVSHAAADYFVEKYKITKPMVITNCSLASEKFLDENKNPGFEVLNHGQFYAGRGYDIMVEAAPLLREHPEIKLALRGFGVMEQQLRDRVAELNADNVVFYPKVRVEELIPKASGSMVGLAVTEPICLNFKLSVSNKLFEYASAGLPVIMSDIPEHRYLNEKYNFGIIIPDDSPKSLADAAIRLYTDKELYQQLANNAKTLTQEVNWETEFGRLIDAERRMISRD